jgi:LysR family transcriptional regulator, low CO2-responsive transcriptional regulator
VTPAQLKAFACVVRLGSVKAAADQLGTSEAAVSMHVAHLRRELGDQLFTRTSAGLAFTPGGLRLASRAVEIVGLQDRTVLEVSQAGHGGRLLRMTASRLFAEHAAPGLIDLFPGRADDLAVELSVHSPSSFPELLTSRTVDVAIGPTPATLPDPLTATPFLNYEVLAVARPDHPLAGRSLGRGDVRGQTWLLGPSAVDGEGLLPGMLHKLGVPERQQRIFQNDAAALEEAQRSDGIALALRFAVTGHLAARRLAALDGPGLRGHARWAAIALPAHDRLPATAELLRFITTPRATQAMVRGAGVHVGRFRPSLHVTLWS